VEKTLFHFFFGLGLWAAKKMKVCFVRWGAVGFFYKFIFEAVALEAVTVVVQLSAKNVDSSWSVPS